MFGCSDDCHWTGCTAKADAYQLTRVASRTLLLDDPRRREARAQRNRSAIGHAIGGLSAYYLGRISTVTAILPARVFKVLCGFFRPELCDVFSVRSLRFRAQAHAHAHVAREFHRHAPRESALRAQDARNGHAQRERSSRQ